MATGEKNVSPEERLLNVIRGKDGKDSKGGQAASASVDEQAPPLDEAPPSEPAPVAPTVRRPAPVASPPAASSPATASAPAEAQTTGPRPKGALGDEKLKAALSRKVAERTNDKPGSSTSVPKGVGGAAAAIARAAAAQEMSAPPSTRPSAGTTIETTRFIPKKNQGDTSPSVRYVSMSFAAIILMVLLFSAYEIVAAIKMEPIPDPPSQDGVVTNDSDLLEFAPQYQLEKLKEAMLHRPFVGGELEVDRGGTVLTRTKPAWVDELQNNYSVSGRLGDPAKGGELILRDKRDKKQYFIGMKSGIGIAGVTIHLKEVQGRRAIFHDEDTQYEGELTW